MTPSETASQMVLRMGPTDFMRPLGHSVQRLPTTWESRLQSEPDARMGDQLLGGNSIAEDL